MSAQSTRDAKNMINYFAASRAGGMWPSLSRAKVAAGALARIDDPDLIDQGDASLCGPACFVHALADNAPESYASAIINLFEYGRADFQVRGSLFSLRPSSELRYYHPQPPNTPQHRPIDEADWIILASIRNSENVVLPYLSIDDEAAAATLPGDMKEWFEKAGYTDVKADTSMTSSKDLPNAQEASDLFKKRYKVCLLINANMLDTSEQDKPGRKYRFFGVPNHWVALASPITFNLKSATAPAYKDCDWEGRYHQCIKIPERTYTDPQTSTLSMKVWTYGSVRNMPLSGTLSLKSFLYNYYGYVAARF
jgi:hypothetical protein